MNGLQKPVRGQRRCKNCRRAFVPSSHGPRRWCSRACYYVSHARPRGYDGPCVTCGKACDPARRMGRTRACSLRCANQARDPTPAEVSRECARCGKSFVSIEKFNRKHCSARCYYSSVAERGAAAIVSAPCLKCGAAVTRLPAQVRGKGGRVFCSRDCSAAFQVGEQNASWRGGHTNNRGTGWHRIAEAVRVRDGHRCRKCGMSQAENGQRLSVDHVRPWRECETEAEANDVGNLVSLCRSCHSGKGKLERRWLRGDLLALQEYRRSVGIEA